MSSHDKIPWGQKKWLLKEALKGVVPDEVLRGPKSGLTVPYGKWLQTALKPLFFDHLATFSTRYPDILDVSHIEELFRRTAAGRQNSSYMLWKVLNLMVWANRSQVNFLPGAATNINDTK
jgi:asparagine synthase (glutamine-hydrolysing)